MIVSIFPDLKLEVKDEEEKSEEEKGEEELNSK
jgi:hypothetical protein